MDKTQLSHKETPSIHVASDLSDVLTQQLRIKAQIDTRANMSNSYYML